MFFWSQQVIFREFILSSHLFCNSMKEFADKCHFYVFTKLNPSFQMLKFLPYSVCVIQLRVDQFPKGYVGVTKECVINELWKLTIVPTCSGSQDGSEAIEKETWCNWCKMYPILRPSGVTDVRCILIIKVVMSFSPLLW